MSRRGETGSAVGLGYRLAPGETIFSFIAQMSLKTLASILLLKAVWNLNWHVHERVVSCIYRQHGSHVYTACMQNRMFIQIYASG